LSGQGEIFQVVNDTGAAIASMTGFAAREGMDGQGASWSWELRSVNNRGLDLRLRLPEGLGALEAPLRKRLSEVITRGSVTLSLRLSRETGFGTGAIEPDLLETAIARLHQVREAAERHFVTIAPPSVGEILSLLPHADRSSASDLPTIDVLLADAEPLIAAFDAMRRGEGRALAQVLTDQLGGIAGLVEAATAAAAARGPKQADRLRTSLAALRDLSGGLDEGRVAQELALIASKADVSEELDRLAAHVEAAAELLEKGGPVGRKLDFLMQEFNREANTLCSKSQDATLTAIGLDLKLAIDQTREQVQNVE
jgi:uncharacterized protein (TIGR00255 family)